MDSDKRLFKTETHLHTKESSPCGRVPAAEMIRLCKDAGYDTVFVTDHLQKKTFAGYEETAQAFDERLEWFLSGYRKAKEEGDRIGVTVLLGAEIRFKLNTVDDYLIYNFDIDFLRHFPRLYDLEAHRFFELADKNGVLVISAHPFRGRNRPYPSAAHGFEFNANPRKAYKNYNDLVRALAAGYRTHFRTSGSDAHERIDVGSGGILTESQILTAQDYIDVLKSKKLKMIDDSYRILQERRKRKT